VVFSTNKADRHDITEILLKVVLNIINLNLTQTQTFVVTLKSEFIANNFANNHGSKMVSIFFQVFYFVSVVEEHLVIPLKVLSVTIHRTINGSASQK
jgi:hypothetical protein